MTGYPRTMPEMKSEINIFREALMLLNTRNGQGMSDEERELMATALIPLMLLPQYSNIPIHDGLEDLTKMLEEAR
jgi:hypothetical protein